MRDVRCEILSEGEKCVRCDSVNVSSEVLCQCDREVV